MMVSAENWNNDSVFKFIPRNCFREKKVGTIIYSPNYDEFNKQPKTISALDAQGSCFINSRSVKHAMKALYTSH